MGRNGFSCPHLGSQLVGLLEIKKLEKVVSCANCDYSGPNLWICLQRNCLFFGCSEQANDHSTEHFQRNNTHCIHLNMSSQRAWCYLCEQEVSIKSPPMDPFDIMTRSATTLSDPNDLESPMGSTGLVGLQNISNTCYMNSALQALSNVHPMTHYFLNCSDLIQNTIEQSAHRNKVGLAKSYQRLMQDIWSERSNAKDYIAPRNILCGIRSVHSMFRGFQQHDTQEFLRCFMDQLHEELKENQAKASSTVESKSALLDRHQQREDLENVTDDNKTPSESSFSENTCSESETEYETCDSELTEESSAFIGKKHKSNATSGHKSRRKLSESATTQTQVTNHSIISDVFDGKLLSSVQCLTCDRISTREETFQDLSLPIPNRDYLNMLHQTHSLSGQSLNSIDSKSSRNDDGWISWLWNLLRLWLWGPSVTLHDCMASFFSADELKGDNMYSCGKCNKLRTGIKYSKILDLPEVLCIHLKRFRHDLLYSSKISSPVLFPMEGFDMRPYLHKDCKSRVTQYNLVSVICHHGTVGGGHYTCFARNAVNNRWYEFDDQHVNEVPANVVQNSQAYVLFYHKYNPQMDLIRAEAREISAVNPLELADIRFYISREWLSRFCTFAEPGPINNWSMLCSHGGVLQSKISLLSQIAVPISQHLWDFLYSKFGGGPAINMLFECEVCNRAAEALTRRQYYELSTFTKYNTDIDSNAIFAISLPWLRKWQQFVRGIISKEPGPITNAGIVSADVTPGSSDICKVCPGSDYAQLNSSQWRFLHGIYGGGPEVMLRGSLNEEIEIIDQDEYDVNDRLLNSDISDTESNIGAHNTNECVSTQTDEELEFRPSEIDVKQHSTKAIYGRSRELKHNKYLSSKKVKIPVLYNNLRKRGIKNRAGLKNVDFFGPKGNYIRRNSKGADLLEKQNYDAENKYNEDKCNSSDTFESERSSRSQSKSNISANVDRRRNTDELGLKRDGYMKRKSKTKGSVKLQKFSHLPESNESQI